MDTPSINGPMVPEPIRFWDAATTPLRCIDIVAEGPSVKTFHFGSTDGSWFRYAPGQFITIELPCASGPIFRTYTLSSAPTRPQVASITVKAQGDSVGTRWLLEKFKIGDTLKAFGPAGEFTLPQSPAKLLFVSGGSGITPMMSMTRHLFDLAARADIRFLHFGRTPADLLFRDELESMAKIWPALKLRWVVEDDSTHSWSGITGRIDRAMLSLLCPDIAARDVFCCGPAPFMKATRDSVASLAGSLARYREESFQPTPAPAPATATAAPAGSGDSEIRFLKTGRSARIAGDVTILAAAQQAGLAIPYACEMGLCGTCRIKKISGEVVMDHQGGISEGDIDEGFILACCARPAGPAIEVDL